MWFLPLRVLKREAIHINKVDWKYKLLGLKMPQTKFPIVVFTDILIGCIWYPFRYTYWDNIGTEYQISTLWSRSTVAFLLFLGLLLSKTVLVVPHPFCLEILCGDISLSTTIHNPSMPKVCGPQQTATRTLKTQALLQANNAFLLRYRMKKGSLQ